MLIAIDRCTWRIILQELVWNPSSFAAWVVDYPFRILASFVRWVLDIVWLKRVLVNFLVVWSHAHTVVAIFIFSDWVALLILLYFRVLELFKRHRRHKCSSCIRPSMRRDRVSSSLVLQEMLPLGGFGCLLGAGTLWHKRAGGEIPRIKHSYLIGEDWHWHWNLRYLIMKCWYVYEMKLIIIWFNMTICFIEIDKKLLKWVS